MNASTIGGGRVVRRCWVNFQCWSVLLIWILVGQGPIVLAVGAGGGCLDIFSLIYHFSFLSLSLWETARYRLKYCLKGSLSPKQPTNQLLPYILEESIFNVRSVRLCSDITVGKRLNNLQNNGDPDQMQHNVASDLGLHFLLITLLIWGAVLL